MKRTKIIEIPSGKLDLDKIQEAATVLKEGGTVAFPTETVYGLGANALEPEAAERIFKAKGRPSDNPLIVHIAELESIYPLIKGLSEKAKKLAKAFWPGPLTLVLEKSEMIPDAVSAGLPTVGIRMPSNPVARALIKAAGIPVAAPSANLSGKPSPTTAEHVLEDMTGRADSIIISDNSEVGVESTVIDMTKEPPVILRPGMITKGEIESIIGDVLLSPGITTGEAPERPASPGMKYTHYSPKAQVILVGGTPSEIREKIRGRVKENPGLSYGILTSVNSPETYADLETFILELGENARDYAKNLFSALRDFDRLGANVVLAEQFKIDNESLAAADRLLHASGYTLI